LNPQTDSHQEFTILYRFFKTTIDRYIFLVIDNDPLARQLIRRIQLKLKASGKEIGHLELGENEPSVYNQVEHFLSANRCNGLLISELDLLIYKNPQETLPLLNKARDAFEKFRIPIGFIVNQDNLKKIIRFASDFYQMRDLPDFHFPGTAEVRNTLLDIDDSALELFPDEDLKAHILEEQLRLRNNKQSRDDHLLNHIVIPLLKIYVNKRYSRKAKELYYKFIKDNENQVKDKLVLGDYHSLVYNYQAALEIFQKALHIQRKKGDKIGISILYKQIALVYQRNAEFNPALEYYQKAMKIDREMSNSKGEAHTLHEIGRIFEALGEYAKVLDYLHKALEIYTKIDNSKEKASVLSHIGYLYYLKGKYKQALDYYGKALDIRKKISSKDDLDLATSYNNISFIYSSMGKFEDALEYQKKSLTIREKALNKMHPYLALSYSNLSMIYLKLGRLKEALKFQQKALNIRIKILPTEHPDLAYSFNNLSQIYNEIKKYNLALQYQQKALKIRKKILDPESPDIADSYSLMASIYQNLHQQDKAREYTEKASAILKKAIPQNH